MFVADGGCGVNASVRPGCGTSTAVGPSATGPPVERAGAAGGCERPVAVPCQAADVQRGARRAIRPVEGAGHPVGLRDSAAVADQSLTMGGTDIR